MPAASDADASALTVAIAGAFRHDALREPHSLACRESLGQQARGHRSVQRQRVKCRLSTLQPVLAGGAFGGVGGGVRSGRELGKGHRRYSELDR